MREIVYKKHGDVTVLEERDGPEPRKRRGRLRVEVYAIGLNPLDCRLRRGEMRALSAVTMPRRTGSDFAGVVLDVGQGVEGYAPGDRVFGMLSQFVDGASADLVSVRVEQVAHVPETLDLETAAGVPLASLTAYQALTHLVDVGPSHHVLVNGASGGVGSFATQLCKIKGARLTTVTSHRNTAWMSELGADNTLDYNQTDFTKGPQRYDLVFDCYGNRSFASVRSVLESEGTFISVIPDPRNLASTLPNIFRKAKSKVVAVRPRGHELKILGGLIDAGQLEPVIDRVYERSAVHDAYRFLETKRARGKVVLRMRG